MVHTFLFIKVITMLFMEFDSNTLLSPIINIYFEIPRFFLVCLVALYYIVIVYVLI